MITRKKDRKVDMINHPPHYTFGKIQPIDVTEDWDLDYYTGTAVKYIARAKHKDDEMENLQKAIWYLQRKVDRMKKGKEDKNANR